MLGRVHAQNDVKARREGETYPLYIFPGGLTIDPSPIEQYLPMDITTC